MVVHTLRNANYHSLLATPLPPPPPPPLQAYIHTHTCCTAHSAWQHVPRRGRPSFLPSTQGMAGKILPLNMGGARCPAGQQYARTHEGLALRAFVHAPASPHGTSRRTPAMCGGQFAVRLHAAPTPGKSLSYRTGAVDLRPLLRDAEAIACFWAGRGAECWGEGEVPADDGQ